MRDLARDLRVHLLLGSIPESVPRSPRTYNTSVLIGPRGDLLATYRKLHLFDIEIRGKVSLRESRFVAPGKRPVLVRDAAGPSGVVHLLRPALSRSCTAGLRWRGAQVLFVPAAFTAYTGPHHWLPLLRARAIENQCWVVAPAQVGRHAPDRQSHGESVIVDPWGEVVARKLRGAGWIAAEIDLDRLDRVRRGLPCLEHTHPALVSGKKGRTVVG